MKSNFDFTLVGGTFVSTANRFEYENIAAKYANSFSFGSKIAIWFTPTIAFEGGINYTQTPLQGKNLANGQEIDASLFFSALKIIISPDENRNIQLGGGFGLVSSAFDLYIEGDTHPAFVFSLAFSKPLSKQVHIYLGVEDYIHNVFFTYNGYISKEILQNDLLFNIGFTFSK